jgi:hypothetical protein
MDILKDTVMGFIVEQDDQLRGFDGDLIGFQCKYETQDDEVCPFRPGCGAKTYDECPLMKRRATIVLGTLKLQ